MCTRGIKLHSPPPNPSMDIWFTQDQLFPCCSAMPSLSLTTCPYLLRSGFRFSILFYWTQAYLDFLKFCVRNSFTSLNIQQRILCLLKNDLVILSPLHAHVWRLRISSSKSQNKQTYVGTVAEIAHCPITWLQLIQSIMCIKLNSGLFCNDEFISIV